MKSCTDDQIRDGVALARRFATGLHLHCAETERQVERTRSRTGRTPVGQLAALEVLGNRTVLAHCVWVDDDDRRLLADTGTHVAHCPHANLKLGSGIAPIADLRRRGVNVTLATDGAKANNRLDPFDVMKFASLLQKGVLRDPAALPPGQILDMATRCGAAALGIPAGAIVPGLAADLILVRLDSLPHAAHDAGERRDQPCPRRARIGRGPDDGCRRNPDPGWPACLGAMGLAGGRRPQGRT